MDYDAEQNNHEELQEMVEFHRGGVVPADDDKANKLATRPCSHWRMVYSNSTISITVIKKTAVPCHLQNRREPLRSGHTVSSLLGTCSIMHYWWWNGMYMDAIDVL